jgi:hypothetical protein
MNDRLVLFLTHRSAASSAGDTVAIALPGELVKNRTGESHQIILRFSGGGAYAPGRLMFDADGNLWSGVNWMPGSQSNAVKNIGGGVAKFGPDGSALSPPVTGFIGAGINGIGWGTAVTRENLWVSSFNGKILVTDLQGRPVASEQDFPFREKLHGLMASAWRRTAMYGSPTARAVNCSFSQAAA